MKFWQFLQIIWPSLLEACSPRSVLRSVFFLASNHCKTASSLGSSFWVAAQLVTCMSTRTCSAATHTSFSFSWSPSTTAGSSPSPSGKHLRLLHPGWLAWSLGQDEWLFNSAHLPLYYLALSGIPTGN